MPPAIISCIFCRTRVNISETVNILASDLSSYRSCLGCANHPETRNCVTCGILMRNSGLLDGKHYCLSCLPDVGYRCVCCGDCFHHETLAHNRHLEVTMSLCHDCYDDSYRTCSTCSTVIHNEDCLYHDGDEDCEDAFCSTCFRRERNRALLSTSFKENKFYRTVGYEIEFFAERESLENIQDSCRRYGNFHADGSINASSGIGSEFASLPSNGDLLFENLSKVCSCIRKNGGGVNTSCGLHIHLDVRDMKEVGRENIKDWWLQFEPLFFSIVSPSRRTNDYTIAISRIVEEGERWGRNRYVAFNICAFEEHGTFEVRLHHGTLNATKISNWMTLLLAFFETFHKIPLTQERMEEVEALTSRELMIFFFRQISIPLKIRKYVMARYHQFNIMPGRAPYILLNKRGK